MTHYIKKENFNATVKNIKQSLKEYVFMKFNDMFFEKKFNLKDFSKLTEMPEGEIIRVLNNNFNVSVNTYIKIIAAIQCEDEENEILNNDNENDVNMLKNSIKFIDLDLHTKTREELAEIIYDMNLQHEIDWRTATRSNLIKIIKEKQWPILCE